MRRGWFAVGVYHPRHECNIGTLFRSAVLLGTNYLFTIGRRYRRQASDTVNSPGVLPVFHYESLKDFQDHRPSGVPLVGVELHERAASLQKFCHPERAVYLLGAEDHGLPPAVLEKCQALVRLDTAHSLNVSTAGSILMWHRKEYSCFPKPSSVT